MSEHKYWHDKMPRKEREGKIQQLLFSLYHEPMPSQEWMEEKLREIIETPCPDCVEKDRLSEAVVVFNGQAHPCTKAVEAEFTKAQERVKELEVSVKGVQQGGRNIQREMLKTINERDEQIKTLTAEVEQFMDRSAKYETEADKSKSYAEMLEKELESAKKEARVRELEEVLREISCGTYSSFPVEYKDLCKVMMSIAKQALDGGRNE